jgi:microcystin-dependent protein
MDDMLAICKVFAGDFAPKNWALCQGQLLPISQNTALYALLGTKYGGDGRTTFGLPDCRGRAVIGTGRGPGLTDRSLGRTGGAERVTLQANQSPVHNHTATASAKMRANSGGAGTTDPSGAALAEAGDDIYNQNAPDVDMIDDSVSVTVTVQNNSGGGQAHQNMQPWIAMNWIICLEGRYPSRS